MVSFHTCHTYWDLEQQEQKGVGDSLKLSTGVAIHAPGTRGGLFLCGKGVLTMQCCCIVKFSCKSYWAL